MVEICQFLNTSFEEEMLDFYLKSMNDEPISTLHWKSKTLETVDASNKGKYLNILSKADIKTFNEVAIFNLKKFNYE